MDLCGGQITFSRPSFWSICTISFKVILHFIFKKPSLIIYYNLMFYFLCFENILKLFRLVDTGVCKINSIIISLQSHEYYKYKIFLFYRYIIRYNKINRHIISTCMCQLHSHTYFHLIQCSVV